MNKEFVERVKEAYVDERYNPCCDEGDWEIDFGEIICKRCGLVITDRTEAIIPA
jgi:hypothetical protein